MMVLVLERNEFPGYFPVLQERGPDTRDRIPPLAYFPIMLAIESVRLRVRDLESEAHLGKEGELEQELYRRPEMRQGNEDVGTGRARQLPQAP